MECSLVIAALHVVWNWFHGMEWALCVLHFLYHTFMCCTNSCFYWANLFLSIPGIHTLYVHGREFPFGYSFLGKSSNLPEHLTWYYILPPVEIICKTSYKGIRNWWEKSPPQRNTISWWYQDGIMLSSGWTLLNTTEINAIVAVVVSRSICL